MATQAEVKVRAEQLRKQLVGGQDGSYPKELRVEAVAHAVSAKAIGISYERSALALGIDLTTLKRWRREGRNPAVPCVLRQVEVVGEEYAISHTEGGRIVVYTNCGLRIEGLDMQALANLVRALQ